MTTSARSIRIGNGAGFWGDNLDAPYLLTRDGELDVLTLEYLAELTMAILAHLRSKDARSGYVSDFLELLERLAPLLRERGDPMIVTNAGGLNPSACAVRSAHILMEHGLGDWPIGVVSGDDLLGWIPAWIEDGIALNHLETGEPISSVVDKLVSANVYLGAQPIAQAIQQGAKIVITGRVADASLTLGPAAAHHGWSWDHWDRLAGASAAGHVIECGAQATGGLWHDWANLPDVANIGYPIADIAEDGSSVITKPEGTGGLVSFGTVAEQLVYEIDDPTRYKTPDVDVDLTSIRLLETGPGCVSLQGSKGHAPGPMLKVSAVYRDGWTASGMLAVVGRDALAKARAAGKAVIDRIKRAGFELQETLVEVIGAGDVVPGVILPEIPPCEVVLRMTARDPRKLAMDRFCREIAPLITSGPQGLAGYANGRPLSRPAFGYWPALVPRELIASEVRVQSASEWGLDRAKSPNRR